MTYTRKPSDRRSRCRASWSGRGFLPGAFSSTKAIWPSGIKTRRSGIPSKLGETNFSAIPPSFFASVANLFSICFSLRFASHQGLNPGRARCINAISEPFLRAIFVDLREFLYKTLIHLVIPCPQRRKSSPASSSERIRRPLKYRFRFRTTRSYPALSKAK